MTTSAPSIQDRRALAPAPPGVPLEEPPPLAPPPPGGALYGHARSARRVVKLLNRSLMVPAHRAGLGQWIGSPMGGYLLLLRVRGRRSGSLREVPLTYYLADGAVWLMAGFGPDTAWYRNLLADPHVELVLPGRRVTGVAREVRDPAARARVLPSFMRAAGLPALLGGVNPWQASDRQILDALDFVPLIRVDADGGPVVPGEDDPGGHAWFWRQLVLFAAGVAILRVARRVVRVP